MKEAKDMKEGWEYKKLGEVAEIIGGSTPKTDIPEYWEGDNYWVTPAELDGSKYIEKTQRAITQKAIEKTNLSLLPIGTVLLSSRAPIGKLSITKSPMYCNQGFKNIVCGESLYNEFVYYYLKNNVDYLQSLGTGATFKEISKKVVEKIEIPVPSITEQKQIVSELDLLSEVIEKQKAQLEELDKLAQSIFYDMFGDPVTNEKGWKIIKLESLLSNLRYGTGTPPQFSNQGYKFIRATNIKGGYVCEENMLFISPEEAAKIEKCKLQKNDMIIVRSGVNAGDVCRISDDYVDQYAGYDIIITINSILANTMFLNILMNNRDYVDTFIKPLTRRAAQPHLNAQQVKSLCIPLPPLSLQQEFAAKVEAIEAMKAKVRQSLKEAETLFNSRMDYYFN